MSLSASIDWQRLGDRFPTELGDARLQLHWAAQLVSAVGTTLLPAASDDSHTNLEWLADLACDAVLRAVAASTRDASEVRCWPHHFDIATLITVAPGGDQDQARTIGVGMSPGDTSYVQPYWYVTPWPYPESPPLPALDGGGEWRRDNWFGAVLTGARLIAAGAAAAQAGRATAFVHSAVAACRALIEQRGDEHGIDSQTVM